MDFIDKERKRDEASMQNLSKLLGTFIDGLPSQESREEIEGDIIDFFKECCYSGCKFTKKNTVYNFPAIFKFYGESNLEELSLVMQSFLPEIKAKDKAIDLSNSPSRRKKLELDKPQELEIELNSAEEEVAICLGKGMHEFFKEL